MSNGTASGTMLVADLVPGLRSSDPSSAAICGGRLVFGAKSLGVGSEPHVWAPSLASSQRFGEGCSPVFPTLESTAPVLNTFTTLSGHGVGSQPGALFLNGPAAPKKFVLCDDYVDVMSAVFVAPVVGSSFRSSVGIPPSSSLVGLRLYWQAWFAPTGSVPIQSTNGVEWVVGL